MKCLTFTLAVFFSICSLHAQKSYANSIKVGDKLTIAEPSGESYQHINIPRKNFIIKRGGIPDMKTLKNSVVIITEMTEGENPKITFERSNGKKFFRVYRTFTANLNDAINNGELELL